MKRKILVTFVLIISASLFIGLVVVLCNYERYFLYTGVIEFGQLKLGEEAPIMTGSVTFAPELKVPPAKFYIGIAEKNRWCIFEECSLNGQIVKILGGWLQSENSEQPAVYESFGLNENKNIKSVVVVGDRRGLIVGIYPNKGNNDLLEILAAHSNLWIK